MIEFSIDNKDIGSEIKLQKPDSVNIVGTVRVDTERDNLKFIEIIQDGDVIKRISTVDNNGKIAFDFKYWVTNSSWFAIRGYGDKRLESVIRSPIHFSLLESQSNFHSAPVYVNIPNTQNVNTRRVATSWLARLKDMENILSEENIDYLVEQIKVPDWDAVSKEVLLSNRIELLQEIKDSKKFFEALLED